MTFYNLRSNPSGELPYHIIKFDSSLNPESAYNLGHTICECPAGHRPTCRHRQMLPHLIEKVDTAWFWNFEAGEWQDPLGTAAEQDEVAEHDEATGGLDNPIEQEVEEGTEAPGHTDLMISPEAIDEALEANPLPEPVTKPSWRRI